MTRAPERRFTSTNRCSTARRPSLGVGSDWPAQAPTFASTDTSLCVGLTAAGAVSGVSVGARVPAGSDQVTGQSRLVVPGGRAALVRAAASPGSSGTVAAGADVPAHR